VPGPFLLRGNDGADGTNGSDGATGPTGVQGPMGPMGMPGMGMPGMPGAAGTNGATGATGAEGPAGADGANGNDGADGLNGNDGMNGTDGMAGATGATGATGPMGPMGFPGMGMPGAPGTNGAAGATGATGVAGATGATGAAGSPGSMGMPGMPGMPGTPGANGAAGATGATGFLANGAAAGNTPYWNGTAWITNSSSIYNNGGNIGIGTTSPTTAKLVIAGSIGTQGIDLSSTDQYANLRVIQNTNGVSDKDLYLGLGSGAASKIHLYSNNTEVMTLAGSNVGIGTNAPAYKLDVVTTNNHAANFATTNTTDRTTIVRIVNNNASPTIWNQAVGGTGNGIGLANGEYYLESPGGARDFVIRNQSINSIETFRIRGSNGGVGIGTATPNAALQFGNVQGNRRLVLWEDGNNDHEYYGFGMNNNVLRYQVSSPIQSHVFYAAINATSSLELMRIRGDGKVGIGTANPTSKLQVVGLQVFADNSAAISGGLTVGAFYRTSTGVLMVVF